MTRCLAAVLCVAVLALANGAVAGPPDAGEQIGDLEQLLQSVRDAQRRQRERSAGREAQFLREKQRQQALLEQARSDLERRRQENQPLVAATRDNQSQIEQLQRELEDVVRDMGDLASIQREFAGDFAAVLGQSLVSAQLPERREQLELLASSDALADIAAIEQLWLLVQEEMTEASRLRRFEARVVGVDGRPAQRRVLRIGPFTAFGDGEFLRYVPETGELLVPARQPATRYRRVAAAFAGSDGDLAPAIVDPTRGSLIGMLSHTPGLRERIEQGGSIALIIIALGVLGLGISLWRGIYLLLVAGRVRRQLADAANPSTANPLGRVLCSVQGLGMDREELLQLKLDEAVLAEIPALERGNGVIKLLAATSPLLGLLGTVTGMILTFQAISLYGTGDPKLMAGGISQALVTTVLGLVVAIPLLFCHSVIAWMSRSLIQRLDEQCAGVLARSAEGEEGRS